MAIKSIAFWGAEAPPYGGMTVHIKRLSQHLQKNEWTVIQYNFDAVTRIEPYIKNISSITKWYLGLWINNSPKIHYVITTRSHIRFLAALLRLKGKKVIIRVGGQSLENQIKSGGLPKLFNVLSLNLSTTFIGVNVDITKVASRYTNKEKIHLIQGFIPPQIENKTAHNDIVTFFNNDGLKILATGQIFNKGKSDIYGVYHFISSLKLLKKKSIKFNAVLVIYGSQIPDFSENLKRLKFYIVQAKLENDVFLHVSDDELWPIIKKCDVFVRPSITDGDANTIREALFFNKFVIASDCVPRPDSCYVYKNLDSVALAYAIQEIDKTKKKNLMEKGNQILIENLLLKLIEV